MKWISAVLVCLLTGGSASADTSQTWGTAGELFDAHGRLMDWSYAGYHYGEEAIPTPPTNATVTDYGAVPDDTNDDTSAFRDAIAAVAGGGVVFVPAGRFVITDKLTLDDGVVLRGAGRDATILEIPVSLTDVYGNPGLDSGGTSTFSFGQAFIEARGGMSNTVIATVTANASRGDTSLALSGTSDISAGQWIRLRQTDVGGSLMNRLHADLMQTGSDNIGDRWEFHTRVTQVTATGIEIERALPVDVDTDWSPQIYPFTPSVSEVGVESLTVRFPVTNYPGHFQEQGYNAIHFDRVANTWVRDVTILNADYGVNLTGCYFVTVTGVILDTTGNRGSLVGHHGLNNGHGGDNLFVDFDVRTTFVHDLTNEWYATGVVFTRGRGDNLRMDHHRAAPYATLWTELDTGEGTQPFTSGGASNRGPHTAAYDTLWNVRAAANMNLPPDDYGPRMNFIGFQTTATTAGSPYDWWFEPIQPDQLEPANLWEAMRERRLGPASTLFSPIPYSGDATNWAPKTPSRWDVREQAGDARYRLNTSSFSSDGDRLGEYSLLADRSYSDFTMTLAARTSEEIAQNPAADYAVVFGFQDPDNYYYLAANATQDYSQLFVVKSGVRTVLATAPAALIPDQDWHELALSRTGNQVEVRLDGTVALSADDATWTSGAVGVGAYNDAVLFDEISVVAMTGDDAGPRLDGGDGPADPAAIDGGTGGQVEPLGSDGFGGCGCRATGSAPRGWALLLLVTAGTLRRRRRD